MIGRNPWTLVVVALSNYRNTCARRYASSALKRTRFVRRSSHSSSYGESSVLLHDISLPSLYSEDVIIKTMKSIEQMASFTQIQHDSNVFFNYTSGRWLWNEAQQLSARYQPFNIEKLKAAAIKSVNASTCINMVKLPEGAHNRCFMMTMDNNIEVVARIPGPHLPPHIITASEVATLDFLRNEIGIPVPKVFAWSSNKDQEVGVEYIIMEKAQGQELWKIWPELNLSDKIDLVVQLAGITAKISSNDLKCYGSLYYQSQPTKNQASGTLGRFTIGPSAAAHLWEQERKKMDIPRGPWSTPSEYLRDIAEGEKDWILQYARSRDYSDPLRQSDSQESPECHIEALENFTKVAPHIIPPEKRFHHSTISHSDLHGGNIFVEKGKISCIIDWQGSSALPLFLNIHMPKFLKIDQPLLFELPPGLDLSIQEKEEILSRYHATQLQKLYTSKVHELNEDAFLAMSYPQASTRQQLVNFVASTWDDDGLFLLNEMLRRTWHNWSEITGQQQKECPISFTEEEVLRQVKDGKDWNEFRHLFDRPNIPMDGWVHNEDFEEKATIMHQLAGAMVESADDKGATKAALRAWKLTASGESARPGSVWKYNGHLL